MCHRHRAIETKVWQKIFSFAAQSIQTLAAFVAIMIALALWPELNREGEYPNSNCSIYIEASKSEIGKNGGIT